MIVTKIGIIGCGVVGGALYEYFRQRTVHIVYRYDLAKNYTHEMAFKAPYIFICVPAPPKEDHNQDLSIIKEIMERIRNSNKSATVFIRTTVLPGTADALAEEFDMCVVSMPELLTERSAINDMLRLDAMCGSPEKLLTHNISKLFPDKKIHFAKNSECELAKYAHNLCLAVKVNFWNIIADICESDGLSLDNVRQCATSITKFILPSHTIVPGPDGKYGFGGKCYPENLDTMNYYLSARDMGSFMLTGLLVDNNKFREKKILKQ